MSCTSRRGLSVALAGALAVAPFIGTAQASDASFRSIQYHADSQPVISCPLSVNAQGSVQALLCEVTLEPGEHVKDGLNAQAQLWDPHIVYSGDGVQTPHLVLKPDAIGDVANVIVTTNKRTYRLLFRSVPGSAPVYTTFHYDAEARLAARAHARYLALHPPPKPTPPPLTVVQQLERACGEMPVGEQYGTNRKPADIRPARTCHDARHTFIQLPATSTTPGDTPVVVEVTNEGDRTVNYVYDADSRTYRIDGVGNEYALLAGRDRMRVQLQQKVAAR